MNVYDSESDTTLVAKVKQGDKLAYDEIYLRYIDRLYGFALSICKSHDVAIDACHDVLAKIWFNRDRLDTSLSFKSYLYMMLKNHLLNIIKRASRESEILNEIIASIPLNENISTDHHLDFKETSGMIDDAINSLSEQKRKIFVMSRMEGLSHEQIARKLKITKGTVNVQLSGALKSIRKYLDHNGSNSQLILLFLHFLS